MKIIRPTAPPAVIAAVAAALRDRPPLTTGRSGETDHISEPLPLYDVNVAALVDGEEKEIFTHYGWRTLVQTGTRVRFVDVECRGEEVRVTRIVSGGAVEALLEAGKRSAEQIDSDAEFELRMIEGPAVKTAALWLAGDAGQFICYSESGLRTFDAAGFIEHLRNRAEEQRAAYVRGVHRWEAKRPQSSPSSDERPSINDTNRRE